MAKKCGEVAAKKSLKAVTELYQHMQQSIAHEFCSVHTAARGSAAYSTSTLSICHCSTSAFPTRELAFGKLMEMRQTIEQLQAPPGAGRAQQSAAAAQVAAYLAAERIKQQQEEEQFFGLACQPAGPIPQPGKQAKTAATQSAGSRRLPCLFERRSAGAAQGCLAGYGSTELSASSSSALAEAQLTAVSDCA
jgi:hypothetical protein